MTVQHASQRLIGRYASGDDTIPGDQLWSLEAHLEACPACRALLATTGNPAITSVLDGVWANLEPELATPPAPAQHRWRRWLTTWTAAAGVSWIAMFVLVTLSALAADRLIQAGGGQVSLVLLLAPVMPVGGVFVSWARRLDPASELVTATPRAGLYLILRRTVALLVVLIPLLSAAGWAAGTPIALTLVPALAFAAGTLALGGLIGVGRAAAALVALWAAVIVAPILTLDGLPYALRPSLLPVWAAAFAVAVAVVLVRRSSYTQINFSR